MLDINLVREHPQQVRDSEKRRNRDPKIVDTFLQLDADWKKAQKTIEELKHRRNVVSEEINSAKKQQKNDLAEKKIKEMRSVAEHIKASEENVKALLEERQNTLKKIGNVLLASVPPGKDENDNKEIRKTGKIPKFNFPIKDHI
ncbi:serine--tRNA ligase, partial [Candidatus Woesearchaeota archaeon]|nr:serine--tRNA ligase [Candidatus Woesearchaeota archaeon]